MNKQYIKAIRSAKKQLLHMCDSEIESRNKIQRYKKNYPCEIDYNIAEHGNVLIYNTEIRDWFKKLGFKSESAMSDQALWAWYKWYIGRAADEI